VAERATALAELLTRVSGSLPDHNCVSADGGPAVSPDPPGWWGTGPAAQSDGTVLQIAFWPGDLGLVLAEVRAAAGAAGLDPAVGGSAGAGLLHAAVPAAADPVQVAALVAGLRAALGQIRPSDGQPARTGQPARNGQPGRTGQPARGSAVVLHAPPAVAAAVDLFGPVQSLGLMRAVKDQFDPDRLMAPGRFAGGI
jgi:glycolate oxidase FAD binding subunit